MDNYLTTLIKTISNMPFTPRRDHTAGPPFPLEMPSKLLSWYNDHPLFVTPSSDASTLHISTSYEELTMRDRVGEVRREVRKRATPDLKDDCEMPRKSSMEMGNAAK